MDNEVLIYIGMYRFLRYIYIYFTRTNSCEKKKSKKQIKKERYKHLNAEF